MFEVSYAPFTYMYWCMLFLCLAVSSYVLCILWMSAQSLEIICRFEISLCGCCGIIQSMESVTESMISRLILLVIVLLTRHTDSAGSSEVFSTLAWLLVLQSIVLRFPVQVFRQIQQLYNSLQLVQVSHYRFHIKNEIIH